jgi:nucleoside-diphosphate-sugar epimerase
MKVLFIGGTGIISTACVRLAIERGIEMVLLNRGQTTSRPIPKEVHLLRGDIRDRASAQAALKDHSFDVVVNWIAFTPDHIETDLDLFRGKVGQYIFISSASAYQKPPAMLPITESTPLHNPIWKYSQNKIACEDRLTHAYRSENFPMTIVRPSHTYDPSLSPIHGGYTMIDRMRQGKKVIVHGDGTSIWVMTHHTDFAKGFVGLLSNPHAIGDVVQIMSDELLTWNQIYELMAQAAGIKNPKLVHIPSDFIAAFDREWGDSLLGDKTHSVIFDNTKIKRLVPDFVATTPFAIGAHEIIDWFDADLSRQKIDRDFDQLIDRIIAAYESAWPK